MVTHVVLGKFTAQGRQTIQDSPNRLEAARKALTKLGGTMPSFYLTLGPFDFVAVIEAPESDLVAKFVLAVESQGNVETTTLEAFPETEYRRLLTGSP